MKKTTATDPRAKAAEALARTLPSTSVLEAIAIEGHPAGPLDSAVVASFVGDRSADLAVILNDAESMKAAAGTDSALVSMVDVLRPALEAAAAVLGTGVVADSRIEDATALFQDPATEVFALSSEGVAAGWFAIRIRENGVITGANTMSDESMAINLGRISNVEMALTVEIGKTRMSVRDVLSLEPGAVIELDRSAGAPADVLLNGRLIAHGEIVVVDQDYAIRITKILDVTEGLS
ncbi:flagellar motor switch protein FliN [Lacisediminihabitans profunda]|uniref:Flagellar motor switch protein FliN n=1 Tax=Lacisediminihabitans profunda TaxID=2594790 RepID=A0A5C8ULK7_9MICO|nr:flagellar motor switch protein FliN [Lacisediminihabitans profunda]TXN29203.1 flagellar motor switch protein FliN [Lacisediminihabitans profunda]